MASYLEVIAPLKLIAEFQGVAVSTVETRIKIGRASGAIPKASAVRATKKTLMKGPNA
jgi:ribosomal protein L7Ae-like RNA K-turn-binding protein